MRAIANAAGVHLGQLPYHFGTKEALYREIWEYWISQVEADALLSENRPDVDASQKDQLHAVVEAFFAGPGRMLRNPRGRHFVAIMVKEAHDPTAGARSLLEEFIYPNGNRFRDELSRLFPDLDPMARDAGFEVTRSHVEDLAWDFEDAGRLREWLRVGFSSWLGPLPEGELRDRFLDDVVLEYAAVVGSASVVRFLQLRVELEAH